MDKTERYLKSIDNRLKLIAVELRKMNGSSVVTKDSPIVKGDMPER